MTEPANPFLKYAGRPTTQPELFSRAEVALANRNCGTLLESLALDITPTGAHYLLNHFDIPFVNADNYTLKCQGRFQNLREFTLDNIYALPAITLAVTLECAGNGRALHSMRSHSMPWHCEAVGTSEWTGTPLAPLVRELAPASDVVDIVFQGLDYGFDKACGHFFARSMTLEQLMQSDAMLVYAMNGAPLLPQHGAPLRLLMPGWFGMMSVKWIETITALPHAFDGFQQVRTYRYRSNDEDAGSPVTAMRVKSLMVPPGVPDWISRKRYLKPGRVALIGRAWSGSGIPIKRVEVLLQGEWREAQIKSGQNPYAWAKWQVDWTATTGYHQLRCRATDAEGNVQPLEPPWDISGFGNNAAQCVDVFVDSE